MVKRQVGKALFAMLMTASVVSVGLLSYYYYSGGQEAYTGTLDDENDIPDTGDDGQTDVQALAPDFAYSAVDGGTVSLSALRGRVVILDFMATWCGPCKTQIQYLAEIHDEYAALGVTFVSIDVDTGETADQLLAFRNQLGATWHFAVDENGIGTNPAYAASSIPTMVFIDKEGRVAQRDVGVMGLDALRSAIDPLL